jgi:hypothetical protein
VSSVLPVNTRRQETACSRGIELGPADGSRGEVDVARFRRSVMNPYKWFSSKLASLQESCSREQDLDREIDSHPWYHTWRA